jgi:hypothetical protein
MSTVAVGYIPPPVPSHPAASAVSQVNNSASNGCGGGSNQNNMNDNGIINIATVAGLNTTDTAGNTNSNPHGEIHLGSLFHKVIFGAFSSGNTAAPSDTVPCFHRPQSNDINNNNNNNSNNSNIPLTSATTTTPALINVPNSPHSTTAAVVVLPISSPPAAAAHNVECGPCDLLEDILSGDRRRTPLDKFYCQCLPYMLSYFETIIKNNNHKNLVGDKVTLADIHLWNMLIGFFIDNHASVEATLTRFGNIKALRDNVGSIPAVKKWVESRPVTHF